MMGFIDIVKLNKEIDTLIATQAAEIEVMKADADAKAECRFLQMMTSFEEMGCVAKEIGEKIAVYTDDFEHYCETLPFYVSFHRSDKSVSVEYETRYGGRVTCFRLRYGCAYEVLNQCGKKEVVNIISKWWAENAAEFRHRFEDACINAIREKAERANAEYARVKEECR